jgi:nicotinamide phosphoribosyltransferase
MNSFLNNLILDVDSYKSSHFLQYPPNTTKVFSYIESRGGKYAQTVMFGLQPLLKKLEVGVTKENVEEAKTFFEAHGEPFNYDGWMYIVNELKGKLPIKIKAAPEGSVIPTGNALVTVENTDPKCYWLTSWLETQLLRVWYPITVATQSYTIKKIIKSYLEATSDDPAAELPFKLHDFGSRGVSSEESAALGGAAHLVNFMGSDTVAGVVLANRVYKSPMSGFSIPASEHSSITSWGRDGELAAYRNMLKQFAKPGALVACVSDSYDLYNAVENLWGGELKKDIEESGAILIVRPDSGNPVEVVLKTTQLLDSRFGSTYNTKGFKVLNHVRVIQGDGINEESIRQILEVLKANGYSATNIAFGMGGALLQQVNRDTQKFAMKCSHAVINGKSVEVYKDPVTDHGKKSKKGMLDLVYRMNKFETIQGDNAWGSVLKVVFQDGKVTKEYTLDEIRALSNKF